MKKYVIDGIEFTLKESQFHSSKHKLCFLYEFNNTKEKVEIKTDKEKLVDIN